MLTFRLEPVPLSLDIEGCSLHILLLLDLLGFNGCILLVLELSLLAVLFFLIALLLEFLGLFLSDLLKADDLLLLDEELLQLLVLKLLTLIGLVLDDLPLLLDEDSNLFTNDLLYLELFLELLDLIPNLVLFPGVESLHALQLSFNLSLFVTSLELTLSFGLVNRLLEPSRFIGRLLSLLGKLVLLLLEVLVNLLDLVVQVTVKHFELIELTLLF